MNEDRWSIGSRASNSAVVNHGDLLTAETLEQLTPKFIEHIIFDCGFSQETAKTYRSCLKAVQQALPHLRYPHEITAIEITALKKVLRTGGKPVGERRVNSILFPLRKFLTYCNEVHHIATISSRDIRPMKIPKREVSYLKKEEIDQFISAMDTCTLPGLRMRTLVEVLLSTAMRISEALSINRDGIDWQQKEVVIIGKGNKQRTVFLNDRAISWLQKYMLSRKDLNPALFVTFGKAQRLSPYDLSKQFKHYAQKAGLKKKVTPHILRHTAATLMSHAGADIRVIQQILGHSDIETTARYYLGTDKSSLKQAHAKYLKYD